VSIFLNLERLVEGAIFYKIIAMIVHYFIVFGAWIKFEIYERFVVFWG
jgi:hypothetical protein